MPPACLLSTQRPPPPVPVSPLPSFFSSLQRCALRAPRPLCPPSASRASNARHQSYGQRPRFVLARPASWRCVAARAPALRRSCPCPLAPRAAAAAWRHPSPCTCCQGCEAPGVRRFAPVMFGIAADDRGHFFIPVGHANDTGGMPAFTLGKAPCARVPIPRLSVWLLCRRFNTPPDPHCQNCQNPKLPVF